MKDLVKEEFQGAIKKGTGQAILLLKKHPELDFSGMLLEACLKNLDYDPQCSGDRAEYLFEMIGLLKDRAEFEEKLLIEFLKPDLDDWGTDQMFELARLMAQNGNQRAKTAMYQKYDQLWESEENVLGAWSIISLDGAEGLLHVTEKNGKYLEEYPEGCVVDGWVIQHADESIKGFDAEKYLHEKAKENQYIRAYLQAVNKEREDNETRIKTNNVFYDEIKLRIESDQKYHGISAARMQDEDFERLARDFQAENDEKHLIKYLRIFSHRKYPGGYQDILKYVHSKNEDVSSGAIQSLQYFKNEEIRKLMATNFINREYLSDTFRLLKENYQPADAKTIEVLLEKEDDPDEFHYMAMSLEDVADKYEDPALSGSLLIAYKRGYCSMCRERFVRGLVQLKSLPNWIIAEGVYDCNKGVREIITGINRNAP